jgi:hypothetical protein
MKANLSKVKSDLGVKVMHREIPKVGGRFCESRKP